MMGAGGAVAAVSRFAAAGQPENARRYSFVQIDIFTSHTSITTVPRIATSTS
jgi:hypothetical protein